MYAVVIDDEVIGTFEFLIMENLAHFGRPSAVVEDVVVRDDFRGRGVGSTMMRFALAEAVKAGCYKMMLSSNQDREDAHRFYESLGFARHGFSYGIELRQGPPDIAKTGNRLKPAS